MAFSAGTRFGPYEVFNLLGAGGMGEVYRARDTRLNRDVALKILPDVFSGDPERRARFEREAQVLASMNHSHIAQIYGLEESQDVRAIVMELVPGETLADRLARGPIPLDEALPIARQIAEALEVAHDLGVIHRDLKPANVKVRPDGTVKVLDFGLAKLVRGSATGSQAASRAGDLTASPTMASPVLATSVGVLLGTAAYMSPEQARGRDADRRSDLWAFGCVLYEMVTGHRAFDGEEVTDLIVAIVSRDPDWGRLPPDTPQPIQRLLRRCLVKSPTNRLADASVARIEIDDAIATPIGIEKMAVASPAARAAIARWWMVPWAVAAISIVAAAALTARALMERHPRPSPVAFAVSLAEGLTFSTTGRPNMAISRDGSQIVYSANGRLYRRLEGEFDGRPIPGTDGAVRGVIDDTSSPAFSPDGTAIVFYAPDRTVKRISAEGGTAVTVCAVEAPFGLIWDTSGIIVGQGARGIFRCGDNGGAPQQLVKVAEGEEAYGPQMIAPDQMMFTVSAISDGLDRWDKARIVVQSLASGQTKTIVEGGSDARYVTSGHLLYASGGTIMGVPFDLKTQSVRGAPVPVIQGVRRSLNATTGVAQYSVSDTGTLIYVPGPPRNRSRDRAIAKAAPGGTAQRLAVQTGPYVMVRATRDGRRLALASEDPTQATIIVAATEGNNSPQRLTFTGNNRYPVWSPDGRRLAFQSDRDGDLGIFVQNADGSGTERLTRAEPETEHAPQDWSPDGKVLLYAVRRSPPPGNANRGNIEQPWSLSMLTIANGASAVIPHVVAQDWVGAVFSPDGRWIAYRADSRLDSENGALSLSATAVPFDSPNRGVFVQPFPQTGTRYQAPKVISDFHPAWTPDGESLVYIPSGASGQMAIVRVAKGAGLTFGVPSIIPALVTGNTTSGPPRAWDILPDGSFIGPVVPDEGGSNVMLPQLRVVLNWTEQLERLSPAKAR